MLQIHIKNNQIVEMLFILTPNIFKHALSRLRKSQLLRLYLQKEEIGACFKGMDVGHQVASNLPNTFFLLSFPLHVSI
jgi:hypothetical protein